MRVAWGDALAISGMPYTVYRVGRINRDERDRGSLRIQNPQEPLVPNRARNEKRVMPRNRERIEWDAPRHTGG